ncbi:MAG TPA: hypothetical protein PLU49_06935 [Saprospiraceae bacterium]|nr:hypothetical protein [Saprospiraceae bacterium]
MGALKDLTIPLLPGRYYHIFNRGINRQGIFYDEDNYKYFLHKYAEKMTGYFDTYGYCLLENHFHLFVKGVSADALLSKAIVDFDVVNRAFVKEYVLPWLRRIGLDILSVTLLQGEDFAGKGKDLTNFRNLLNQSGLPMKTGGVGMLERDLTNFRNLLNLYEQHGDTRSNPDAYPLNLSSSDFLEQLCSYVLSERFRGFMLGYAKAINKQQKRTGSLFQKAFRRKYIPDDEQEKKQVLCYIHHNPIHHHFSNDYGSYLWSSYNAFLSNSPTRLCRNEALHWFGNSDEFIVYSREYETRKKISDWIIDV